MPINLELRSIQTGQLFKLLKLEKENEFEVKGLRSLISETKSTMPQEDVAWVEKNIKELYS